MRKSSLWKKWIVVRKKTRKYLSFPSRRKFEKEISFSSTNDREEEEKVDFFSSNVLFFYLNDFFNQSKEISPKESVFCRF